MFSEDYNSSGCFDLCLCTSPRTPPRRLLQGRSNRMGIGNRLARSAMCSGMFIYTHLAFLFSFFSTPPPPTAASKPELLLILSPELFRLCYGPRASDSNSHFLCNRSAPIRHPSRALAPARLPPGGKTLQNIDKLSKGISQTKEFKHCFTRISWVLQLRNALWCPKLHKSRKMS